MIRPLASHEHAERDVGHPGDHQRRRVDADAEIGALEQQEQHAREQARLQVEAAFEIFVRGEQLEPVEERDEDDADDQQDDRHDEPVLQEREIGAERLSWRAEIRDRADDRRDAGERRGPPRNVAIGEEELLERTLLAREHAAGDGDAQRVDDQDGVVDPGHRLASGPMLAMLLDRLKSCALVISTTTRTGRSVGTPFCPRQAAACCVAFCGQRHAVIERVAGDRAAVFFEQRDAHAPAAGVGIHGERGRREPQWPRLHTPSVRAGIQRGEAVPAPVRAADRNLLRPDRRAMSGGQRRVVDPGLVLRVDRIRGDAENRAAVERAGRAARDDDRPPRRALPAPSVDAGRELDVDRAIQRTLSGRHLRSLQLPDHPEDRRQSQESARVRKHRHVVDLGALHLVRHPLIVDLVGSKHQLGLAPGLHVRAGREPHHAPRKAAHGRRPLVIRHVGAGQRMLRERDGVAVLQHRILRIVRPLQAVAGIRRDVVAGLLGAEHLVALRRILFARVEDHGRTVDVEHDVVVLVAVVGILAERRLRPLQAVFRRRVEHEIGAVAAKAWHLAGAIGTAFAHRRRVVPHAQLARLLVALHRAVDVDAIAFPLPIGLNHRRRMRLRRVDRAHDALAAGDAAVVDEQQRQIAQRDRAAPGQRVTATEATASANASNASLAACHHQAHHLRRCT